MTPLLAKLSVEALAKLDGKKDANPSDLDQDVVRGRLVRCGVEDATTATSDENLRAALARIEGDPDFWRKHYALHPNAKRVKNWIWVHSKYREQAQRLLDMGDEKLVGATSSSSSFASDVVALKRAFDKFHKKIKSHSEFEDTQLFRYFQDAKIGDQDAFRKLNEDHGDLRAESELDEAFGKVRPEEGEASYDKLLKPLLQSYVDDLMAHLEKEEQTILGPWLLLTDAEYKRYRSYLSWMYCVMY